MTSWWPLVITLVYFLIVFVVVKKWASLKQGSMDDLAVASRSFKWYMIMFTVLATWFVGSIYTAFFSYGVLYGTLAQYATIYTLAGLVLYYYISPRIWIWGKVHNLYNMPDYVELRYKDKWLGVVFALAGLLIGAPWQVIAFKTFGYAFNEVTYNTLPVWTVGPFTISIGILLIGVFVLWYVVSGGMKSVVLTDFVQGIISVVIVLVGVVFVAQKLFGGFGEIFREVERVAPDLLVVDGSTYWAGIILASALGSYCWLEIFNRIFIAESVRELKLVARGAPIIATVVSFFIFALAMGGIYYKGGITDTAGAESAFLVFFSDAGGPMLLAFAAIVIIAAEMSSVDSQLTALGVVVGRNVVEKIRNRRHSDTSLLSISRWSIIIWSVIAMFLAMGDLPLLITIAIKTYELLTSLFPAIIIGAFWKRANRHSVWAGIVVGFTVSIWMSYTPDFIAGLPGYLGGWPAGMYGFAANLIVFLVVAFATGKQDHVDALFDEVETYEDEYTARDRGEVLPTPSMAE
ncbi:MAG: sodium:solute symporter family protein [Thermoleophilia bacterium]